MTKEDIRQLREKMELSIDKFADRIGVHRATVYRWESDEDTTMPRGMALKALQRLWKRHMT